jgi:hypothetical protein
MPNRTRRRLILTIRGVVLAHDVVAVAASVSYHENDEGQQ